MGKIHLSNYNFFADFKHLKKLVVGKGDFNNLNDCDILLQYLPQLEHLEVQGFLLGNNIENGNSTETLSKNYSTLQRLGLRDYVPTRNDELIYTMDH
jgi:hypothetical protein